MARKKEDLEAIDVSTLKKLEHYSGGWGDYKYETFLLRENETEKAVTQHLLRIDYRRKNLKEPFVQAQPRRKHYVRRTKYLCIGGALEGKYQTIDAARETGYSAFYNTGYGAAAPKEFPRKVLLQTTRLAQIFGLKW